ncbi:YchJ family protein [Dermatobacter hominis]|uniref:YchJ family protein n=1 Tax=Dermatobacter hominis TaxID=2884263 RepID=UPI001D11BE91|nr:YchJ family metal-binding protein [Dermatobacter hominis]UDY36608.1 SEC-C domain-containing protein [Dermatobacter hominis]
MAGRSGRAQAAACPCGSGAAYSRCCRPLHLATAEAPTAEALMRSRYSAHAKRLPEHLLRTWHPTTRPAQVELDPATRWTGLRVLSIGDGGPDDLTGVVEFVATYETPSGPGRLHEVSRFERTGGRWTYVDGDPD